MSIHFDASAALIFRPDQKLLGKNPNVTFCQKRIRCGGGMVAGAIADAEA